MKPRPGVEGKPMAVQIHTVTLVRETPKTAAEVALFDRLLTDTSVNGVYHYYIHIYTKSLLIKRSYFHDK